ncbi:MAG: sugar ABC transporter permease [Caldilineales bacterium]|nr:sugar ABC transporter permease [Caldilineales bacterium]MCW5860231.1 sugar ABC transporter permease [Caldilineales bacterium]
MSLAQPAESSPQTSVQARQRLGARLEAISSSVFIWPAVLLVLVLSIFPLLISLYLSFSRFKFVKGGFQVTWVGLANYRKLLVGSQQEHFLGKFGMPSLTGWLAFGLVLLAIAWGLVRFIRSPRFSRFGLILRVLAAIIGLSFVWLLMRTLSLGGRPGALVVTWFYVFAGITVQYLLGLGLALLVTQPLPGRRFFRVVFLLPMMITPVGIAYMFRMLTDTDKGPFQPIWQALGLGLYSWVNDPWGARIAVLIGDIWQWTPFMFIVLLAALEGQSIEQREAAVVDGASRWQVFQSITFPQIIPVSLTVILIRLIEAFKIVDLPNVLTNGGPGTATESLTLFSFISWRTLDLGGSAAIAYSLLVVVTFIAMVFVNLIRRRFEERTVL